jgi:hypothetical protein
VLRAWSKLTLKSITTAPPFEAPADQLNVIEVAVLEVVTSAKEVGASGTVRMIAPLPAGEIAESP